MEINLSLAQASHSHLEVRKRRKRYVNVCKAEINCEDKETIFLMKFFLWFTH